MAQARPVARATRTSTPRTAAAVFDFVWPIIFPPPGTWGCSGRLSANPCAAALRSRRGRSCAPPPLTNLRVAAIVGPPQGNVNGRADAGSPARPVVQHRDGGTRRRDRRHATGAPAGRATRSVAPRRGAGVSRDREGTIAPAAARLDGDVLGRLPARRGAASGAGPPLPRRADRRGARSAVGRVRRQPALLARGSRASLRRRLRRGSRRPVLHDRESSAPARGAASLAPLRPAGWRVRRGPLRHRHLVRGARVRRARRRLLRRPPVDPARAARGRGSLPSLDEAPRTRLGDHRRDLPVPKLVAGKGPRAAEARSPLGRRRQGKAGRPGLRDFLDQAARTWARLLHRPGSRPRGLGGRALPPPSARGNPLGDRRALRGLLARLGAALALGPSTVRADATYEMLLRTEDRLVGGAVVLRLEEHTSELQSPCYIVFRLLL